MKVKIGGNVGDNNTIVVEKSKYARRELRRIGRLLRRELRSVLREELYSDEFAQFLRDAISGAGDDEFRERAQELLNETVRVETTAGPVTGTLIEVGQDYLVIRESETTQLIVPFRNAYSIQPV